MITSNGVRLVRLTRLDGGECWVSPTALESVEPHPFLGAEGTAVLDRIGDPRRLKDALDETFHGSRLTTRSGQELLVVEPVGEILEAVSGKVIPQGRKGRNVHEG